MLRFMQGAPPTVELWAAARDGVGEAAATDDVEEGEGFPGLLPGPPSFAGTDGGVAAEGGEVTMEEEVVVAGKTGRMTPVAAAAEDVEAEVATAPAPTAGVAMVPQVAGGVDV